MGCEQQPHPQPCVRLAAISLSVHARNSPRIACRHNIIPARQASPKRLNVVETPPTDISSVMLDDPLTTGTATESGQNPSVGTPSGVCMRMRAYFGFRLFATSPPQDGSVHLCLYEQTPFS